MEPLLLLKFPLGFPLSFPLTAFSEFYGILHLAAESLENKGLL